MALAAILSACPTTPPNQRTGWRPVSGAPRRGSVHGGNLVFVELAHPRIRPGRSRDLSTAIAKLPLSCRFGATTVVGRWDRRTNRHMCQVPPHARPEPVNLSVVVAGQTHGLGRFHYTTPGKQDLPLLRVKLGPILAKSRWVRQQLPRNVRYGVVLKKTEPIATLGAELTAHGGVDHLFVATVHDGIRLRRAGVMKPIAVLFAVDPARALELLHYDLEPVALGADWVRRATGALHGAPGPLKVHLWIDTGLGRQGVLPTQALSLARRIRASAKLTLRGIGTHLCCVSAADGDALKKGDATNRTVQQKTRFDRAVKAIRAAGLGTNALVHVGASDVVRFGLAPLYYDLVRVGCLLLENDRAPRPNFTWTTRVAQTKTLPKGWCLGYGCGRQTDRITRTALISHTPLLHLEYRIHGRLAPVLLHHGYTVVLDVTDHRPIREGDPVQLTFRSARGNLVSDTPTPVTLIPDGD
jgi:alanine racemase